MRAAACRRWGIGYAEGAIGVCGFLVAIIDGSDDDGRGGGQETSETDAGVYTLRDGQLLDSSSSPRPS